MLLELWLELGKHSTQVSVGMEMSLLVLTPDSTRIVSNNLILLVIETFVVEMTLL